MATINTLFENDTDLLYPAIPPDNSSNASISSVMESYTRMINPAFLLLMAGLACVAVASFFFCDESRP